MSGTGPTIGGASFELSVTRAQFALDLEAAIRQARNAAGEIAGLLSGAGPQVGGGLGVASQDIRSVSSAASSATDRVNELSRAIDLADTNAVGALASATDLARAYDVLAASANAAGVAITAIGAASSAQGQQVAAAVTATTQAVQSQAAATTQAANQQAAAVQTSTARIIDATKAQADAQKALNTLRTAFGREDVTTGREQVTRAVTAADVGVQGIQQGDAAASLRAIQEASVAARAALDEVNQELRALVDANPGIEQAARDVRSFEQELERLLAIQTRTAEEQAQLNQMLVQATSGTADPNATFGNAQGLEAEAETYNQLNTTAKNLTTSIDQLATAEAELDGRGKIAAAAAREQAAALRAQEQAARQAAAADSVAAKAIQERADAQARAQLQYSVGTNAQAAVQNDPLVQASIRADEALQRVGLTGDEAAKAVNGLQAAINAVGRSAAIKDLQIGFEQTDVAALSLNAAMVQLGQGEPLAAFRQLDTAVTQLRQGLVEGTAAAEQLRARIAATGDESSRQLLQTVNARNQALQTAIGGVEKSIGGIEGPQVRQQLELERAARVDNNEQRRLAIQLEREERDETLATGRAATALQNVLGATGAANIGRPIGGAGRATSALQLAGLDVNTGVLLATVAGVTALAAGLAAATKEGIAFNEQMQVASVRLGATKGSAVEAAAELQKLKDLSVAKDFGTFGTDDLAAGLEKLDRIGQASPRNLQRIADVAAATGNTFAQTSTQLAVFYERLQSGLPLDDTLQGLVNAGILTADLAAQLKAADKAGADASEKIAIFDQAVDRFNGTAKKMGDTAPGAFQRLRNELGLLFGALTKSGFDSLANAVGQLADALSDPKLLTGAQTLGKIASILFLPTAGIQLGTFIRDRLGDVTGRTAAEHPPQVQEQAPPDNTRFIRERFNQDSGAFASGQSAVAAFAKGFDDSSAKAFDDIDKTVETHLKAISGGTLGQNLQEQFGAQIEPLLAKITQEIQDQGKVSVDTAGRVRAALGGEADTVLELADTYGKLRQASDDAAKAKAALASVQLRSDYEQQVSADIATLDQKAIDDATKLQATHDAAFDKIIKGQQEIARGWDLLGQKFHDSYQQAIDALDAQIKTKQRESQNAAQQAQDHIQGEQDDLSNYQQANQDRRDKANAALDAEREQVAQLQASAQAAQNAQTEHQAAFQAVLNGTIDLFNQEHTQQDEITQAIIKKWDAEISGARRAKDEADQRVRAETEQEHLLTLAYDKRIAAARAAGREDQARALERERDRVLAAQQQKGQVDRDEAAVAADRLTDRTNNANQAAQQQGSADQVAVNNAQSKVDAAQKELDARQKIEKELEHQEDEEVKRRQAQITNDQRVEAARARAAAAAITDLQEQRDILVDAQKVSDAFYKSIVDNINNTVIPAVQANKDAQHTKDQQQIDDAKTIKDADDKYWKDRKAATDQAIVDANAILTAANNTVTEYNNQITRLDTINQRLDDRILKEQTYLNLLRQEANLPPLPVTTRGATNSPTSGNVDDPTSGGTRTTPQGGGDAAPSGGSAGSSPPPVAPGTTTAPPRNTPGSSATPTIPGAGNAATPPPIVTLPQGYTPVDSTTTAAAGASAPATWPDDPTQPPPLPYGYDKAKFVWYEDKIQAAWSLLYKDNGQYRSVPAVSPIPFAAASGGGGNAAGDGALSLGKISMFSLAAGGGAGKASLFPPSAPDYPSVNFDTSAHARALPRGYGTPARDTGRMQLSVAGNLIHIERVDASDPADVQNMIALVESRIWGGADAALEISKRGGLWNGRRGG